MYLTKMHVNKMLSVHKDGSPWVWSRSFLTQTLAAAAAAATAKAATAAATAAAAANVTDVAALFAAIYP